jgi:hypothetical protein
MAMKKNACRDLFFIAAVLFIGFAFNGQTAAVVETPCLDENQVRQAMREEAFRLLVQKIAAVQNGSALGFDYHIEQAYAIIKKRLPPDPLPAAELATCLRQIFQNPNTADNDHEFQILIDHFVLGTSLEIINTLQYECDEAEYLIAQIVKLAGEISRTPHPHRETLDRALRQSSVSKKMVSIIKNIDRHWRIPPAGSDNFSAFNIWRKNMTGRSLDRDQRLVFDLGDRYAANYPFLGAFMEKYRRLAETFHQAVRNLNAMLGNSSESGL